MLMRQVDTDTEKAVLPTDEINKTMSVTQEEESL